MKKILALLLAMVMVIGLVACGGGSDKAPETTAAPAAEATPTEAAPTEAAPVEEKKVKVKYCKECGAEMSTRAKYCNECGAKQTVDHVCPMLYLYPDPLHSHLVYPRGSGCYRSVLRRHSLLRMAARPQILPCQIRKELPYV